MTTTTETLREYAAKQLVVPAPVRELMEEHGEDALVVVTRRHTPFGTFVVGVELAA